MENGAFAAKEQMLYFPQYFQIHDMSMASKGATIEFRVNRGTFTLEISWGGEVVTLVT